MGAVPSVTADRIYPNFPEGHEETEKNKAWQVAALIIFISGIGLLLIGLCLGGIVPKLAASITVYSGIGTMILAVLVSRILKNINQGLASAAMRGSKCLVRMMFFFGANPNVHRGGLIVRDELQRKHDRYLNSANPKAAEPYKKIISLFDSYR